ncbi:MAG: response regulator [Clostridia bacterium]|nr:response regulator [Clostridia bacterium]
MITIMIADDNIEQANQLAYMLTQEKDLKIINLSHDGNIALKQYLDIHTDVLILDLNMPGINGITLLEKISTYDTKRNVIILSGSTIYRAQISNISKVEMIYSKPFDISKLINSIREIKPNENTIEVKIDNILKELKFDSCSKGTKLLKSAILISYKEPQLKLDNILEKVKDINNEKNARTVHSIIDKYLNFIYSSKENFDIFCKKFSSYYGYKPTTKNFIKYIAHLL